MAERDVHVRRSGTDYAHALMALLPQGQAWPRTFGAALDLTVTGLAKVFGFVDGRAADMLEIESDPRITFEMLEDWERNWGLPDPCFLGEPQDLQARHDMLMLKMTLWGAQSREFFMWVAEQLGYTITISEFAPFMAGVSNVGDTRTIDTAPNLIEGPFGVFE
jgi:uncharacterized protein YmfQ (DUF2313 family)